MSHLENNYLDYVSDKHLLQCISNLYNSYIQAKTEKTSTIPKFYRNKVDTFKLTFDLKFNNLSEEDLIKFEVSRQIDKSINNAIGTFHEEILGGIKGFSNGKLSGYDIKADDNSLFAEIKNKHNTMNSSSAESVFQKLEQFANDNQQAKCYLVQTLAKKSFKKKWEATINKTPYRHDRVFMISGDRFYGLLTGDENALFKLYEVLPKVIDDFLATNGESVTESYNILEQISNNALVSRRNILDEISFQNFGYYQGFDSLNS
ncbi:Eco47II family restriction endonuclease [Winogradskyella sp. 3972H.M.0a.05]|uniref:Eco47II family restriction endonuclease n=1 Tax=Winogradskyella sp. 3972H.M.0a.05 TaxID=2950277 RepID=UPI0033917AD3